MIALLTSAAKPAGGAPLDQLAIVSVAMTLATVLMLWLIAAYRRGGAAPLRRLEAAAERHLGVPGWAALPGLGAILFATVTITGATWDIGLHIDVGRDEGPLGTAAHYPLLLGLFGTFLMGLLATGMAPQGRARSSSAAFYVLGAGRVPAGAASLLAGATFGMAAFPLDDLWHRIFGQDVTLWGPTHVMIIVGTLVAGVSGTLLLVEGARVAGRNPFHRRGFLRRLLPALLGGVFLYLWAATVHEFNWGVPQFRLVWHPLILAFGAAQALVLVRVLAGRGSTLLAIAFWLPLQVAMTAAIGGPLHVTAPGMPLFIAEALLIELVAARAGTERPLRFGAIAGLAVGTIGFAAEYGWTHLVMPLPWPMALLAEGLPVAIVAGLAGGILGGLMAQALTGTLAPGRRPLIAATLCVGAFIALGTNATLTSTPEGATATMILSDVREALPSGGREAVQVADLSVRMTGTGIEDPLWADALGWQGGGRYLDHLVRQPDGSWQTSRPVPIGGTWKTFVRIHGGRTMLAAPIRMPRDREIDFAGFPARPEVTRAMVFDQELLQIERKPDAPMGLWVPAIIGVLSLAVAILAFLGSVMVRLGRMAGSPVELASSSEDVQVQRDERRLMYV